MVTVLSIYGELVMKMSDSEIACLEVANDIQGYLDGEWDGNEEGWKALISRLTNSVPAENM